MHRPGTDKRMNERQCVRSIVGPVVLWVLSLHFCGSPFMGATAMEYPLEGMRLSSEHKLAFCAMHKNSMTTWTRLFMDLAVIDPVERYD